MTSLIVQCGGPTPVMNASLAGALETLLAGAQGCYGARFGLEGLLHGDWADLSTTTPAQLARLKRQPGAALGGGRYAFRDGDLEDVVQRLRDRAELDARRAGDTLVTRHHVERAGGALQGAAA